MGRIIKQRARDKAAKDVKDGKKSKHDYNAYGAMKGKGKGDQKKGKGKGDDKAKSKDGGNGNTNKKDLPCFAHFKHGSCPHKGSDCIYSHDDKHKPKFEGGYSSGTDT